MLPALALVPTLSVEGVALASSVAGFFTWLWQKNLKNETGNYDFSIESEYSKIKDNSLTLQTELKTYATDNVESFQDSVSDYVSALPSEQVDTTPKVEVATPSNEPSLRELIQIQNSQVKENSQYLVEQQRIMNNNLLALNTTLAKILESKNSSVISQNVLTTSLVEFLPTVSMSLAQIATLPKILTTHANSSEILQSETIGSLTDLQTKIDSLVKVTKEQELSPTVNSNVTNTVETPTVNNTINMDTTKIEESTASIATATETLASGVTDQIETNKKLVEKADIQIEDLTFNKTANSKLTDLEGNNISPRDSAALKNAEVAKEVKDMNDTPLTELLGFTADMLGWGVDTASDTLGVEDGLNSSFNPLKFFFDELEADLEIELAKEKGEFNE